MDFAEIAQALAIIPPFFKDCVFLMLVLSLIEVAPVKLNPWKWIKAFIALPKRMEDLEKDFHNDRAYRWRSMILTRSDMVRHGDKLSLERWNDTIDTIDRYTEYCDLCEREGVHFINGKAVEAIEFLQKKYREVKDSGDFLV